MRERGHDVVCVRSDMSGSKDTDVIARAQAENRTLVTWDEEFGELADRCVPSTLGVVVFRMLAPSPARVVRVVPVTLELTGGANADMV